jgi:hypothetical protein
MENHEQETTEAFESKMHELLEQLTALCDGLKGQLQKEREMESLGIRTAHHADQTGEAIRGTRGAPLATVPWQTLITPLFCQPYTVALW